MNDELNSELEVWRAAQAYAGLFGEIPSSFTIAARALASDADKGTELSTQSKFQLDRLLKSEMLSSPLEAFISVHKQYLPKIPTSLTNLSEIIGFRSFGVLLAVIYYHKRVKKLIPSEEWAYILPFEMRDIDIATLLGLIIRNLNFERTLTSIAGRYFALGAFFLHDKKGYTEYRRILKSKDFIFDTDWETERLGCSTAHIASSLFQNFGLGVAVVDGLSEGLLNSQGAAPKEKAPYGYWLSNKWVRSLVTTGKEPDMAHKPQYYPDESELSKLRNEISSLKNAQSGRSRWLDIGPADLSE